MKYFILILLLTSCIVRPEIIMQPEICVVQGSNYSCEFDCNTVVSTEGDLVLLNKLSALNAEVLTLKGEISIYRSLVTDLNERYDSGFESCKMYNPEAKFGVEEVYHSIGFYCVRTRGRTLEQQNKSACHGLCHALINNDMPLLGKNHFCS